MSSAALRACRPRQWVKNFVVLSAPVAGGALAHSAGAWSVGCAFVVFCLLSSSTYLVNDVRDRDQDRSHPVKCLRPIASGELPPLRAIRLARALAGAGLMLAVLVRPALAAVGIGYLALTFSYSFWWRRIPVVDVVAVAAGFVLRAIAGGVAAGVPPSRSFLLVTSACALLLVIGKRLAELRRGGAGVMARRVLRHYSPRMLQRVLMACAVIACAAYGDWAFTHNGYQLLLELSLLPFAAWLYRYIRFAGKGEGEAPEELVLGDFGLLMLAGSWMVLFLGGVYGAR